MVLIIAGRNSPPWCGRLSRMLQTVVVECAPDLQLRIRATESAVRSIDFLGSEGSAPSLADGGALTIPAAGSILDEAARQLCAYFAGSLRRFTIPLDPQGTDFQKR